MSFIPSNLVLYSPLNVNGSKLFKYNTTDTLATATATNYFEVFANQNNQNLLPVALSVKDMILVIASDGEAQVIVTSINPITVALDSADIPPNSITTAMLQDGCVTNAKLASNAVTNVKVDAAAAIAFSKLAALTSAHFLVGSGTNVATDVAMSGDCTLANTGAVTIANDAVTTAKIADANVTLGKLASGITPSHIIKFAGQPTTVGGAAAEAIAIPGVLNTDLAFVQLVNDGTNNVTVSIAVCTADTLTVTFSADPGNDAVINYQILRAAA